MSSRVLRKLQQKDFVENPDAELSDDTETSTARNRFDLVRRKLVFLFFFSI